MVHPATLNRSAHSISAALSPRRRSMPAALYLSETAEAAIFRAIRVRGASCRYVLAAHTGLSVATVNRRVNAMLDAHLLRERVDLTVPGTIGRPRVPVEVNHEPFMTLGIHIGARSTSFSATDLRGRTLDVVDVATPRGTTTAALAALANAAHSYLRRWQRRRPLWIGVTSGGVVDTTAGTIDHPALGWKQAPVAATLGNAVGLPVSVACHVDAMAAAELLLGPRRATTDQPGRSVKTRRASGPTAANSSTSLHVYARETVGYALVINGRVHRPQTGPGIITMLPAHSTLLGEGTGHLESTISDHAVVTAARKHQIIAASQLPDTAGGLSQLLKFARAGNNRAQELLSERARVLGTSIALLHDLFNPDELVVGGQAFTDYPEALPDLRAAINTHTVLPPADIRVTVFGNRIQEAAAGITSLSNLYADPIGAMRRNINRPAHETPHPAVTR